MTSPSHFCFILNLHSLTTLWAKSLARDFLNTSCVKGYWQWKENSGQVWEGSLHVFPVGLSVSMLLSTQLIMQSSRLFFSGPTAHCRTFWWRDTDLHHRAPSVWSRAHCQAGARSWYAYWWRILPVCPLLPISEDVYVCADLFAGFKIFWKCLEILFNWAEKHVGTQIRKGRKQ